MRPFYILDRWGEMRDTIASPLSATHTDTLNGEDGLEIDYGEALEKGDRILWSDTEGEWHEHLVSDVTLTHDAEGILANAYAANSLTELKTFFLEETEPRAATAESALHRAIDGTAWTVGPCDEFDRQSYSWFHTNAYDAVTEIAEKTGGEIVTEITVEGAHVTQKTVSIVKHRGSTAQHYLDFSRTVDGIERTVSADDVYTALYGWGKSQQTENGGQQRKLDFGSINGGQKWVGDDAAREKWGFPDGQGGKRHSFGQVEFGDCVDQTELLALTKAALAEQSVPKVTYTVTLAQLGEEGRKLRVGDDVDVRDGELDLTIHGRVLKIQRDLLDEAQTKITLGNLALTLTATVHQNQKQADETKTQIEGAISEAVEEDWLGREELKKSFDTFSEQMQRDLETAIKSTQRTMFGTCSTASGTRVKVVTVSVPGDADGRYPFELAAGAVITVNFTHANSLENVALNVNQTGEIEVATNGRHEAIWEDGATIVFMYDGRVWQNCSTPVYASEATIGNPGQANFYTDGLKVALRLGLIDYIRANFSGVQIGVDDGNRVNIGTNNFTITYPDPYSASGSDIVFTIEQYSTVTPTQIYSTNGVLIKDSSKKNAAALWFAPGSGARAGGVWTIEDNSEWWIASNDGYHKNKIFRKSLVTSVNNQSHCDISASSLGVDTCAGYAFIASNGDLNAQTTPVIGATYNSGTRGVRVEFKDPITGLVRINIIGIPAELSYRIDPGIGDAPLPGPEAFD